MENLLLDRSYLTPNQRRLLGGWRDILDDIRLLCTTLTALPDGCACGHGGSHLSGSCACCQTAPGPYVPDCPDCETLLAQVRPRIDELTVDTMRFFPVVTKLLHSPGLEPAGTDADRIEREIITVVRTFERLAVAADNFRAGCRASHLQVLKECGADLLVDVTRLDHCLEGTR